MATNDPPSLDEPHGPAPASEPGPETWRSPDDSTSPPPPAPPTNPPLRRSTHDKVIAGVCGGLGIATGVDPVWFRLGFVVLGLSSGVGILAYIIAWILIPEETEAYPAVRQPRIGPGTGSIIVGIVLLTSGIALFIDALVPWFDRLFWPVAIMALGAGLLYFGSRR